MILQFKVQGKTLTKISCQESIKASDIYKCKFYLDEKTWKGLEIFVVFQNNFGYSKIVPLGKYAESLSCALPNRMVTNKYFKMFIYAKDSFHTNSIFVILSKSNEIQKRKTTALTDLLKELENKIDNIIFEDNQLKCYANNRLIDTIYIDNVDEVLLNELIQENLGSFRDEIDQQLSECVKVDDIKFENGIINFK